MPGRRELEEQCRAAVNQPGPWQVYADWLIEHGEVEGELAALRRQGESEHAEQLFERHAPALGWRAELAGCVERQAWRHGFLSGVVIRRHDDRGNDCGRLDEITREVLASPIARFVDSIQFGPPGEITMYGDYDGSGDWTATMEAVAASGQAAWMRELVFDYSDYRVGGGAFSGSFGDFSTAWSRLPRLERLYIDSGGSGRLGAVELPALRAFSFSSSFVSADLDSICAARWPSLEYLDLDLYGTAPTTRLDPLLRGAGFPALLHLRLLLYPGELLGELIGALAASSILPRLRSVTLLTSHPTESMVDALTHHARAFRHLDLVALADTGRDPRGLQVTALPNFRHDAPPSREAFELGR